jgi:AcrR family transcriptional regulator
MQIVDAEAGDDRYDRSVTTTERGPGEQGLRERSKARRRDAVIRAAFRLFAEHGYDATTVSDIAAAAEVSPRTVALYFPSKQDIALSRFRERASDLTTALRDRAPGTPVTAVLADWLRDEEQYADEELRLLARRMFAANSELNALRSAWMADAVTEGARIIAEQAGLPADDPGARVAAVAASSMLLEISNLPRGPERDQAVATTLAFLDAGIKTLPGRLTRRNALPRGR